MQTILNQETKKTLSIKVKIKMLLFIYTDIDIILAFRPVHIPIKRC